MTIKTSTRNRCVNIFCIFLTGRLSGFPTYNTTVFYHRRNNNVSSSRVRAIWPQTHDVIHLCTDLVRFNEMHLYGPNVIWGTCNVSIDKTKKRLTFFFFFLLRWIFHIAFSVAENRGKKIKTGFCFISFSIVVKRKCAAVRMSRHNIILNILFTKLYNKLG